MDDGPEEIGDEAERAAVRRQAVRVHLQAAVLAGALTLAAWLLPS